MGLNNPQKLIAGANVSLTPASGLISPAGLTVAATGGGGGGGLTLIQSIVSAGSSGIADFTSIPATFTHLRLIGFARSSAASALDDIFIQVNTDSTVAHYTAEQVQGLTSGVSAVANPIAANYFASVAGNNATANHFGLIDILFPFYADTNHIKSWQGTSGSPIGNLIKYTNGCWNAVAAINEIRLNVNTGPNFVNHSTFNLYGF